MIGPILNIKLGNKFHHNNGPNQRKNLHKHTDQQYQSIPFQISSKVSPTYLKEKHFERGLDNKEVR